LESAEECVTTHPPKCIARKIDGAETCVIQTYTQLVLSSKADGGHLTMSRTSRIHSMQNDEDVKVKIVIDGIVGVAICADLGCSSSYSIEISC